MRGVDISHYQKGLTIRQIRDAGYDFAIIKVTEGSWLRDGAAVDFYREAYETGFPVGCYCYSHATTVEDAAKEAQFLLQTINRFPMPCGVFLDMEEPKQLGLPREKLLAIIAAWGNAITEAGYIPGVYSSAGTLWATISPDEIGKKCLIWVAKWSQTPPDMPCDLWQDSDSGNIDGVTVDTDRARSDRFKTLIETGGHDYTYHKQKIEDGALPEHEHSPEDKPDISGALGLFAAYIQTAEFRENFLNYIERRNKK
jgi:GH25 family lysozyme M1 (1,4-beta-N-acetylmuramidase)